MVAATEHLSAYLESFERLSKRRSGEPEWLRKVRAAGMQRFAEAGFPTTKNEEYKYTNLAPLAQKGFQLAEEAETAVLPEQLARFVFEDGEAERLVFVNGRFDPGLSQVRKERSGWEAGSLAAMLEQDPGFLQEHLAAYAGNRENVFAALNTAFLEDGAVVRIADRAVIDKPIHLVFVSAAGGADRVTHPRVLIVAGRDSQASVIETFVGLGDSPYWTNPVTEIAAAANARLEHCRIEQEGPQAFHTSFLEARQQRDSHVAMHSVAFGGALVRNDVEVVLEEEAAECALNGLYAVTGRQHVDNHTCIDHAKPHCTSQQLYKGVLDGRSVGVFNGKIIVRPDAQKTDAVQSNKNLLLSEDANINTKPQLQIDANDVRCTHGATVGQIDRDAVFYLRSRGLSHHEARSLLTYAFAADILERVRIEPLRKHFESILMDWLNSSADNKGERS